MKIVKKHNYHAEDMLPYSVVRNHLRYALGDAEDLIKAYIENACDYMETITNRVFCSSIPADFHEDVGGNLTVLPDVKMATATVYLNREDLSKVQTAYGLTGNWVVTSLEYMNYAYTYTTLSDTKARVRLTGYPVQFDFTELTEPADANEYGVDLYKIVLQGGDNVIDLPKQYRQAMLLLVGHYDSQREAEFVGGLTSEVKEGVHRLMSSVKVY